MCLNIAAGSASGSCGLRTFPCGPGASRTCVPEVWLCDGDNDCGDNSDEAVEICGYV